VPTQTIRIVKKGDNLFRLTRKVYGYADAELVEWVMENNPHIKDPNRILIGEEIVFPEVSEEQAKAKVKAEKVENKQ
jgi:phage tail protein X